jgi:hypothetical protein
MLKFIISFFIIFPVVAFAHGGVSQNVGKFIVTLNQIPLSPLVGEEVTMTFVITGVDFKPFPRIPVQFSLTDTFSGDESRDVTILTEEKVTDANGAFEFVYTFNKENYFDAELAFTDPQTGESVQTGFLIQTRPTVVAGPDLKNNIPSIALWLGVGLLIGFVIGRRRRSRTEV